MSRARSRDMRGRDTSLNKVPSSLIIKIHTYCYKAYDTCDTCDDNDDDMMIQVHMIMMISFYMAQLFDVSICSRDLSCVGSACSHEIRI